MARKAASVLLIQPGSHLTGKSNLSINLNVMTDNSPRKLLTNHGTSPNLILGGKWPGKPWGALQPTIGPALVRGRDGCMLHLQRVQHCTIGRWECVGTVGSRVYQSRYGGIGFVQFSNGCVCLLCNVIFDVELLFYVLILSFFLRM